MFFLVKRGWGWVLEPMLRAEKLDTIGGEGLSPAIFFFDFFAMVGNAQCVSMKVALSGGSGEEDGPWKERKEKR
jgi:hypothetical protein